MSPFCGRRYKRVLFTSCFAAVAVFLTSAVVLAQEETTPKVELFTGYQWLNVGGSVPAPGHSPNAPVGQQLRDIPQGVGVTGAYNFSRWWSLEGDFGGNWDDHVNEYTASVGPRLSWRNEGVNMFLHTLLGLNRLTVPGLPDDNGLGAILGGGMDIKVWRPLSIRLIEADYVWGKHHYPDVVSPVFSDLARPTLNGARLRSGLVWNFGFPSATPPAASCSVQQSEVMVGEPVTATASGSNFNPKHTLNYTWSSTGGKVTGKDNTATIDTNGIAGGNYTVTARISDPKMKKGGEATCTANFTVKEPPKNPPTMSCSANPTSVQAGTSATVTCNCTSPDSVPVTVSNWTASAGSISGQGNTATLNTTGASAGPITVTATCTDSRNLTNSATTQVTVETPPPPPPQASKLSQCDFPNEKKPWRVDNTCKAILDDVAQRLQHDPDARLVIVGNAEPTEKRQNPAAERAVNSKAYLSDREAKQAIDPSRIEVRTGSAGSKTAEYWVVPAGANFAGEGTQTVDENTVKAVPDHPAAPKKKVAKPKAQ